MKIKKSNNKNSLVKSMICVLILLFVGGVAFYVYKKVNHDNNSSINYSPPTQTEIDSSQDSKKRATEDEATKNAQSGSKTGSDIKLTDSPRKVGVGISYANIVNDKLEIRAFADGVIEGNGTCTAKVEKGDESLSANSKAFIDVSSSICEPIYIDKSKLTPGTWTVVVTYDSPDATGLSDTKEVMI